MLIFLVACAGDPDAPPASPDAAIDDAPPDAAIDDPPDAGAPNTAWPMFRHDPRRTGVSPYVGPVDGRVRWRFEVGAEIYSSPAIGPAGTIYVGARDHRLHAVHPDGTSAWSFDTGWNVDASPAVTASGQIIVGVELQTPPEGGGPGIGLYALDPDGSEAWHFATGNGVYSSASIDASGRIYFASRDSYLYALAADGSLAWRSSLSNVAEASPASHDGVLSIMTNEGVLHMLDETDGTSLLTRDLGICACSSAAVARDGTIYVGVGSLRALAADGSDLWTGPGDFVVASPAVTDDGTIYVGSLVPPSVYAVDSDGAVLWQYTTAAGVISSPLVDAKGTVYVGDRSGVVYAIAADGSLSWSIATGDAIESSPALDADGILYVGSTDGFLYAIESNQVVLTPQPPLGEGAL